MRNRNKIRLGRKKRQRKRRSIPFCIPWNRNPQGGTTITLSESAFDMQTWMELCFNNDIKPFIIPDTALGKNKE